MSSDTINDMIHEFDQGPHRDLYLRYSSKVLESNIAHAIVKGILNKEKVPQELLDHLARLIKYYEEDIKGN